MASMGWKTFYQQILIGVGFESGLFAGVGIDPEQEVLQILNADPIFFNALAAINVILWLIAVGKSWKYGMHVGVFALLCSSTAGFIIVENRRIGIMLLLIAIYFALAGSVFVDSRRMEYDLT